MSKIIKLISTETKKSWGITDLQSSVYDPLLFWHSLEKRMLNLPLTPKENINYMKAYTVCVILQINFMWPNLRDENKGYFQQELLNDAVFSLVRFYEKDPQKNFFSHISTPPANKVEERKLHIYIRGKARFEILSVLRRLKSNNKKNETVEGNLDENEEIFYKHFSSNDPIIPTQLDDFIISYDLSKGLIQTEATKFINKYFFKHDNDIQVIKYFFSNKSFQNMQPENLWKINVFQWKATEVWDLYKKIDEGILIYEDDKHYLYLFYLMICITALHHKHKKAVKGSKNHNIFLITRTYIGMLTELVIKTFLHFTKNLEENVFSRVEVPPPVTDADVKAFGNAIKDKPRLLLKTMPLPKRVAPKPVSQQTSKPITKAMNYNEVDDFIDFEFPEKIDLHEVFESYEVFEELTKKVIRAFETGEVEEGSSDSKNNPAILALEEYLAGTDVKIHTIFSYLNPKSQEDITNLDFSYLIDGCISSLVVEIINHNKNVDDKINVVITDNDSSLDNDLLAQAAAEFLKIMIDKQFKIDRKEVSDFTKEVLSKYLKESNGVFSIKLPEGSEFDSFRTMIELNGSLKASLPQINISGEPYWTQSKELQDKMVQILNESLTAQINNSNMAQMILSYL